MSTPKRISDDWILPDELWDFMEPLLPRRRKVSKLGRKPLNLRKVANGIFYVLRTGVQWKAVPREFGSGTSIHRYFQDWVEHGVFWKLWQQSLLKYDELEGIQWDWQSIDGGKTKSPLGGEKTGNNPTDRSKCGTKRSLITDGSGVPLGLVVAGANVHDTKLFEQTLKSIIIDKPEKLHHLCGDKGYDSNLNRHIAWAYDYEPHIHSRGQEIERKMKDPKKKNRRWVVERTFSWFNKFRRLFTRWEKKVKNYEAFLHFVSAIIGFKAAGILG